MPSKSTPFTPSSILFRPRPCSRGACRFSGSRLHGWRRRVLPPGPIGLLRQPFIAIAGLRRPSEYKGARLTKKDRGTRVRAACTARVAPPTSAAFLSRKTCELWNSRHKPGMAGGHSDYLSSARVGSPLSLAPCPTLLPLAPRRRCSSCSLPSP